MGGELEVVEQKLEDLSSPEEGLAVSPRRDGRLGRHLLEPDQLGSTRGAFESDRPRVLRARLDPRIHDSDRLLRLGSRLRRRPDGRLRRHHRRVLRRSHRGRGGDLRGSRGLLRSRRFGGHGFECRDIGGRDRFSDH